MEVQAALGSDIALVFDECTPFHADREYTARSTERTHRWLDRCLAWHDAARPRGPGRLRDRPGRRRRGPAPRLRAGGRRARRARRDRDRRLARRGQGADVRGRRVDDRGAAGGQAAPPAGHRRGRRPRARRRARHRHLRLRDADPDRPPRHGDRARPGEALARRPRQGPLEGGRRAAARGLPLPGLRGAATPAPTCTTCCKAKEQTAMRAAHDPQPRLPAAPDGRAARRDRRGPARRGRGRACERRGRRVREPARRRALASGERRG